MLSQTHRRVVALVGVAVLAGACGSPIGVTRVNPRTVHRTLTQNVLTAGELSESTQNLLFRRDLVQRHKDDPEGALAALQARVVEGTADSDDLIGLAELSFLHGEKSGKASYSLAAALYAWGFLFPGPDVEPPSPYDPRFRLACDLYNRGITEGFASADGKEVELQPGAYTLPFGTLAVAVDLTGFEWGQRRLVHFVPVAEFRVNGLPTRYRWPGLGAPLAASTVPVDADAWDLVAPRVLVPVTSLLRVDDIMEQLRTGSVRGVIELYAAGGKDEVPIGDTGVPLELESTATMAAQLQEAPVWKREILGFLQRIGTRQQIPHLASLEPYQRGRIPIVFVHGTASSAARWAEMVNELDNDPSVRDAYQFWFFSYDTGNPILYSSMVLREALQDAVRRLDPDGSDPALHRMVVIGHSQGGLLTKMTAVESGERFRENLTAERFEDLQLDDKTRDLLRRAIYVHPLPFVRRLIFIATPHQGSYVAGNWLAHQVARLIQMPLDVAHAANDVLLQNKNALKTGQFNGRLTAVDNMTPGNPFVKALASLPIAPGVTAHSIIAVNTDGPLEKGEDGVVAYQSAHIGGVESELVVRSSHSCQGNPNTIAEVRRILLEHLAEEPE